MGNMNDLAYLFQTNTLKEVYKISKYCGLLEQELSKEVQPV